MASYVDNQRNGKRGDLASLLVRHNLPARHSPCSNYRSRTEWNSSGTPRMRFSIRMLQNSEYHHVCHSAEVKKKKNKNKKENARGSIVGRRQICKKGPSNTQLLTQQPDTCGVFPCFISFFFLSIASFFSPRLPFGFAAHSATAHFAAVTASASRSTSGSIHLAMTLMHSRMHGIAYMQLQLPTF